MFERKTAQCNIIGITLYFFPIQPKIIKNFRTQRENNNKKIKNPKLIDNFFKLNSFKNLEKKINCHSQRLYIYS